MPIRITNTVGGTVYANPFVGLAGGAVHVQVDVSALTAREVDARGYLKPGVTLNLNGIAPTGSERVGMTLEAIPIVAPGTALSTVTVDPLVVVYTIGMVNRDIVEDNLGSPMTAAEVTALNGAGSSITLTLT